jgi:hypothetical protein
VALNQTHYHFGENTGTESTYRVLAAPNFPVMMPPAPGRTFLCRIGVQATGGVAHNNTAWQWQYRHTPKSTGIPGAWTNVTATSAVIRTGTTTVFADAAHCTKRLTDLTGTFEASGAGCTHDGSAGGAANDIVANGNSETLIGLGIVNGDTAVGDLIELRVLANGAVLAAYDVVPAVTVATTVLAIESRTAAEHVSVSAPVARISGTVVGIGVVGLANADLADPDLTFTINVWGTTVPGSTDPADYTAHLQGPDVTNCGILGTKGKYNGLFIPPEFAFQQEIPEGVVRVLAKFVPSRTVTFGADATILGDV